MNSPPAAAGEGRLLIIECGAAETRAALIVDDETTRFWFGPARGDEADDQTLAPGRRFVGRVIRIEPRLEAAFVDIGAARQGFLPLPKDAKLNEGALVAVAVKRAPRGEKGATLALLNDAVCEGGIGPLGDAPDAALQAVEALGADAAAIIIDSGAAKAALEANSIGNAARLVHEDASLFERYGAAAAFEAALARTAPLAAGGRIIIDETEAATTIDVDAGGAEAASSRRLRERVNLQAAHVAASEIVRRDIGGKIVIDFLPLTGASRATFNAVLKSCFPGAQKAGWTASGLFSFVLPRPRPSLQDRFTEMEMSALLPARRFSLDFLARRAVCKLEEGLRGSPAMRFILRLGSATAAYLKSRPQWTDRLRARYGGRFEIVADDSLEGRGFELSEQ